MLLAVDIGLARERLLARERHAAVPHADDVALHVELVGPVVEEAPRELSEVGLGRRVALGRRVVLDKRHVPADAAHNAVALGVATAHARLGRREEAVARRARLRNELVVLEVGEEVEVLQVRDDEEDVGVRGEGRRRPRRIVEPALLGPELDKDAQRADERVQVAVAVDQSRVVDACIGQIPSTRAQRRDCGKSANAPSRSLVLMSASMTCPSMSTLNLQIGTAASALQEKSVSRKYGGKGE